MAIVAENTLFGKTAVDAVKYLNKEMGYNYEVVAEILYPAGTASVDAEVMTLKAANPDVVWMASYLSDAILFQQTYKRLDFNTKLFLTFDSGHTHVDFYKIPESEFITSRTSWNWDLKKDISEAADKKFYDKFKRHWSDYEAREYTGVYALYWALEEAGKVTTPENLEEFRTALRDAIKALDIPGDQIIMPWEGIKFDATGQNMYAGGVMGQIFWTDLTGKKTERGELYTVYPFEVASRDAVFPQPTWAQR
jgi:branched-chain amino acid transport system substrate-binding protein